jgi:hypothetical protein
MAAVKVGNHTPGAVNIDCRASQINCLWRWQVVYHYPVILNGCHGAVANHIDHPMEPYSLSLVEIPSSTWFENKDGGKVI